MLSVSSMADDVMANLGLVGAAGNTEFSRADAIVALNRTYWDLLSTFPFREKEATSTIVTVDGTREYSVPTPFEAIRLISVLNPDSKAWIVLERMTLYESQLNRYDDAEDSAKGFPTEYYRRDDKIILRPIPDAVYTVQIDRYTVLSDLVEGVSNYPDMPQNWSEMLIYGATYRGALRLRDFKLYHNYKAEFAAAVNHAIPTEAKEEGDTHTGGLEVLGREYP